MRRINCVLFLCLFFSFSNTFAGDEKGNGGGAWLCKEFGQVHKVELLDIYEAQYFFGFQVDTKLSYKEVYKFVEQRIQEFDEGFFKLYLAEKKNLFSRRLIKDIALTSTFDHLPLIFVHKDWCPNGKVEFAQIVNYQDGGKIIFAKEIFSLLTPYQKAVLEIHEIIYALRRSFYHDLFSITARKAVAFLLASEKYSMNLSSFFKKIEPVMPLADILNLEENQQFLEMRKYVSGTQNIVLDELIDTDWSCLKISNEYSVVGNKASIFFLKEEYDLYFFQSEVVEDLIMNEYSIYVDSTIIGDEYMYIDDNLRKEGIQSMSFHDLALTNLEESSYAILRKFEDYLVIEEVSKKDLPLYSSIAYDGFKALSYSICSRK